jgi:hypothetical protein
MTDQPQVLTPEMVWDVVEPKINEYWRIAKWVFWALLVTLVVLTAILSGVIGFVLTHDSARKSLITTLIRIENLIDERAKDFFYDEVMDRYWQTERPAKLFDTAPSSLKTAFDSKFNEKFSSGLKKILIPQHISLSFELSDTKRDHNWKFVKQDGTPAEIECSAVYPSESVRNIVSISLNDLEEPQGAITPIRRSTRGKGLVRLEKENASYFREKSKTNTGQDLFFEVDDMPPFKGMIKVDCRVTVYVSALLSN